MDERVREDVNMASMKRGRYEGDVRSAPRVGGGGDVAAAVSEGRSSGSKKLAA